MSSSSSNNEHSKESDICRPDLSRQDSKGSACTATTAVDSRFTCNICFDAVVEPVVTACGHLYCWPCLYRWLEPGMYPEERASLGLTINVFGNTPIIPDSTRRVCPVCKSTCSIPTLVPIYVRSSSEASPPANHKKMDSASHRLTNSVESGMHGGEVDLFASPRDETVVSVERQRDMSIGGMAEEIVEDVQTHHGEETEETTVHPDGYSRAFDNDSLSSDNNEVGLRQRLRFRSRDSVITHEPEQQQQGQAEEVPSRPAPTSPQHAVNLNNNTATAGSNIDNPYRNHNTSIGNVSRGGSNSWISTPISPNGRPHGSLTQGILFSLQQAAVNANSNQNDAGRRRGIPSLHSIRDGSFDSGPPYYQQQQPIDVNAETTQYLSRLLIMLTSFVILCLLLL